MLPFRKAFVTGGSGFVGRYVVRMLRDRMAADAVVAVAGREPECDVHLDLLDDASIHCAVKTIAPDLIVHLAGEASVASAAAQAALTWRMNFGGTFALAEAAAKQGVGTFLFASSSEVYGSGGAGEEIDEASATKPGSVYARTKFACETMLADVLPAATRLIVARPTNHIGPGQDERFAVPSFARQIIVAEQGIGPVTIKVGDLSAVRDFMDVRDVVEAYGRLLASSTEGGRETYNIASGKLTSVRDVLDTLRRNATVETNVEAAQDRMRVGDLNRSRMSTRALRDATGWTPAIPLDQTLRDMLDHCRRTRRG